MKLEDKIMILRKRAGWSQEELAERLDVSRQAVSKWEAGQSVPDLDKILRMSELFSVSTDTLLKDSESLPGEGSGASGTVSAADSGSSDDTMSGSNGTANNSANGTANCTANGTANGTASSTAEQAPALRFVNRDEAEEFLAVKQRTAGRIALGTLLCVLSPICLITLAVFADGRRMPENLAAVVGIGVLLAFISVAVVLFLSSGSLTEPYDWAESSFALQDGISESVRAKKDAYRSRHTLIQTIGTLLCILAVIPLIVSVLIGQEKDLYVIFGLDLLLVFVSVGVYCFVRTGVRWNAYQTLLDAENRENGHLEKSRKETVADAISTIYWLTITAGFLAYSFLTSDWERSWIVWPVAGVFYGVVAAIVELASRNRS